MNKLDTQYTDLLKTILTHGAEKSDRTGTGTLSIFGYTVRHNMKDGFPLLTTKKMAWKTIVTELLWFLRGDTNIKYLVDNNCHIWDGDAYKGYERQCEIHKVEPMEKEKFISAIKLGTCKESHFIPNLTGYNLGDLGPIYGKQWRKWVRKTTRDEKIVEPGIYETSIDQIANLINELKTNPDSRRLMVNAWNVGELDQMVLPPCHYGFQVYTRELTIAERIKWVMKNTDVELENLAITERAFHESTPQRSISLMWNQRSVDTFLGLPFNIASYGLLLEIIAKMVNMVPDQLVGSLGDTHLYLNHLNAANEQIGYQYSLKERRAMVTQEMFNEIYNGGDPSTLSHSEIDQWGIPRVKDREAFYLPKLEINSGNENWHLLEVDEIINTFDPDITFKVKGYKSHPSIKAPLSN